MKRKFLLDENVIIAAETLENEKQQHDRSSADLVEAVVANCHSFVLSVELFAKYARRADAIRRDRRPSGGVLMMPLFKVLMVDPEKCRVSLPQESLQIAGEEAIPDDDLFLVRLGVATEAILVTTDDRLIKRLASKVAIHAMRPEEALPLAQHVN